MVPEMNETARVREEKTRVVPETGTFRREERTSTKSGYMGNFGLDLEG